MNYADFFRGPACFRQAASRTWARNRSGRYLILFLMSILFWPRLAASPAQAVTTRIIDVDAVADDNPGGGCTLREAIDAANARAGAGPAANGCTVVESGAGTSLAYQINLPGYTYTLTGATGEDGNSGGDLDIRADIRIKGAGAAATVIDGARLDRVFHILPAGFTVTISGLTIRNGYVAAAATPISGGGLLNQSSRVNLVDCLITGNEAAGPTLLAAGSGGGIANQFKATMTIANSLITANRTTGGLASAGAGLYNNAAAMQIVNSTISNNTAAQSYGGGVYNAAGSTLNIVGSALTGNRADRDIFGGGGGLFNEDSTANIANTTISGNLARLDGGGLYTRQADRPARLHLTHVTITNNTADADDSGAGGGGGLYRESGVVLLKNSLIAGNIDRGGQQPDLGGDNPLGSAGYNLIGSLGAFDFAANTTGDRYGDPTGTTTPAPGAIEAAGPIDPLLDGLTGSPAYHPLQMGSPAIDHIPAGPAGECLFVSAGNNPLFETAGPVDQDQPGTARPQGLACDIGAFELVKSADLRLVKTVTPARVSPGSTLTYTLTFTNAGPDPAAQAAVMDRLPVTITNISVLSGGAAITDSGLRPGFVWNVQNLAPGQGGVITLTGQVAQTAPVNEALLNTAAITSSASDPDPANNESAAGLTVEGPQLFMAKTAVPATNVAVQGQVTYTLVLSNVSPFEAIDTRVTDTLPLNVTFAGWVQQPPGASLSAGQLTWTGTVASGQAVTFVFRVAHTGGPGERVVNRAGYSHPGGQGDAGAVFTVVRPADRPAPAGQDDDDDGERPPPPPPPPPTASPVPPAAASSAEFLSPPVSILPETGYRPTATGWGWSMVLGGIAGAALILWRRRRGK